jgi:hypothetical protein
LTAPFTTYSIVGNNAMRPHLDRAQRDLDSARLALLEAVAPATQTEAIILLGMLEKAAILAAELSNFRSAVNTGGK